MCLGAQASAANEQARRQYQYQLQRREQEWMQTLSTTGVERIQYEQGINASNLQLADIYGQIQDKHGDLVDEAVKADQQGWKEFLQNSTSATLKASGRTGKSIDRISSLDLAEYLTNSSRRARELTNASKELRSKGRQAAGQAAAQQKQAWANQAFIKQPDMAPPQPVMQNVAMASFMDALSIGSSIASMATGVGSIKSSFFAGAGGS